ncbi:hypothetical protein Tco_0802160 [Tanacetum coccineum]|uniref:Uncharacterized protein n=1 Tax=Tanacetum coccineum TaxID=301880 RepID=A0ABQ4ZYV5_9ASTR
MLWMICIDISSVSTKIDSPGNDAKQNQADNGLGYCEVGQKAVTLIKDYCQCFREEQVEDIILTTLEAAQTLSTGGQISTPRQSKKSIPSPDKGQREGKAPMIIEEAPKKTKENFYRRKLVLLKLSDWILYKKKKRLKKLGSYIEQKDEANASCQRVVQGSDLQEEDFAKKMVELVNQRKKHFAEERARAKRNKPMTQSQLRTYMMNYLKNQGTWKLSQLKNLILKSKRRI